MEFTAKNLTVGEAPTDEMTKGGTTMTTIKLAENISKNVGTKSEPKWERVRTNWYRMVAFGDVAEELLTLGKGDRVSLQGTHERNYKDGNEYSNYTIRQFEREG
jgi:single-stranded DNA-binding protein